MICVHLIVYSATFCDNSVYVSDLMALLKLARLNVVSYD